MIEKDADTPPVNGVSACSLFMQDFWRIIFHIAKPAISTLFDFKKSMFDNLGLAKVYYLEQPILIDHKLVRMDPSVANIFLMQQIYGLDNSLNVDPHLIFSEVDL